MSDTAGHESDQEYSPSSPSTRSASPEPNKDTSSRQHNEKNLLVERQLGDALMLRKPRMPGSLTFLRTYNHLLAESQREIDYASSKRGQEIFEVTQFGSVIWTSTEKELFFNALDRKGRDNIKEIAAAVGTKSELEVLEYLKSLHQALKARHRFDPRLGCMPLLGDIPAATEISQQCCTLLDDYADVLVLKESLAQAHFGKMEHGDRWNVDSAAAIDLMNVVDGKHDGKVRGDLHLAATMFYIPDWIRLSQGLFMNFGGTKSEDHWKNIANSKQNITAQNQTPSMTADSVVDFYSLAISVTRRLIQSSIFFAMTRLRGATRKGHDRKNHIRMSDVRAAIEILNMKHRRPSFVDTARRNQLVIADIHHRKGWVPRQFTYDEAEELMHKPGWKRYCKGAAIAGDVNAQEEDEEMDGSENDDSNDEDVEQATESEPEDITADSSSSRGSSELSSPMASSDELEHDLDLDPEEMDANAADEATGRREEAMFLRLMDQSGPMNPDKTMKEEEEVERKPNRQPRPGRQRKRALRERPFDWRDQILYRSEWEQYRYDFADLKEEIEIPPHKRPKYESSE